MIAQSPHPMQSCTFRPFCLRRGTHHQRDEGHMRNVTQTSAPQLDLSDLSVICTDLCRRFNNTESKYQADTNLDIGWLALGHGLKQNSRNITQQGHKLWPQQNLNISLQMVVLNLMHNLKSVPFILLSLQTSSHLFFHLSCSNTFLWVLIYNILCFFLTFIIPVISWLLTAVLFLSPSLVLEQSLLCSWVQRFRKTIPKLWKTFLNPMCKQLIHFLAKKRDLIQTNSRTQSKMRSNGTNAKQRENTKTGNSLMCHQLPSSRVQKSSNTCHFFPCTSQFTLSWDSWQFNGTLPNPSKLTMSRGQSDSCPRSGLGY